jgi:RAD50-interacting protein 1
LLTSHLQTLRRNLDFISKALSTAASRRIWRDALEKLQDVLWGDVLMRHTFTSLGAAQFMRDFNAICSLIERYIPNGLSSLASLHDALRLLTLPVAPADGQVSLKEASDRVFTDNKEAKAVLEQLGIETLTPANARHILQRRVENSE